MIVDCAHYSNGERQHSEPLDVEAAGEIAAGCGEGEFVWLGLKEPSVEELERQRARAEALGAELRYDRTDEEDEPLYVLADPAGHPFCLFVA